MGDFVNLSSQETIDRRKDLKYVRRVNILNKEFQNMSVCERAKKAANQASNNGKCWWIYDYVYKYYMRIIK